MVYSSMMWLGEQGGGGGARVAKRGQDVFGMGVKREREDFGKREKKGKHATLCIIEILQ